MRVLDFFFFFIKMYSQYEMCLKNVVLFFLHFFFLIKTGHKDSHWKTKILLKITKNVLPPPK